MSLQQYLNYYTNINNYFRPVRYELHEMIICFIHGSLNVGKIFIFISDLLVNIMY